MIITDSTPFHPLDYNWPDQPSDKGIIKIERKDILIDECLIGAFHKETSVFLLDQEIKNSKIRRDDPNWHFVVAHMVDANTVVSDSLDHFDKNVSLEVDSKYRLALSKSHTASHLAALALNKVSAKFWKKASACYDSLGNLDFDREAIISSVINEEYSLERYRCGKSLRKNGFDAQFFLTNEVLKKVEFSVQNQLSNWCHSENSLVISIHPKQTFLHEMRKWHCEFLDEKEAIIPCGGTHINTVILGEKIVVNFTKENDQEFSVISKMVST